jgi:hypothetical protein
MLILAGRLEHVTYPQRKALQQPIAMGAPAVPGGRKRLFFPITSKRALGSTQPPLQGVP